MTIFSQFATNYNKETEGVKIEFAPNEDGSIPSVTIRRAGKSNKRYAKALEAATRPYKRYIELGTLDNEVAENLMKKVFAETIIVNWENIQMEKGINIPFSVENALSIFAKVPDFYDELQRQSANIAIFRDETMENDAKN